MARLQRCNGGTFSRVYVCFCDVLMCAFLKCGLCGVYVRPTPFELTHQK